MTKQQVNDQLNKNYKLKEIRIFLRIIKNIGILTKDFDKVKVKIETDNYEKNFNFKLN